MQGFASCSLSQPALFPNLPQALGGWGALPGGPRERLQEWLDEYFEAGRYASRFAGLLHDGHSLHLHGRAVSYVGEMLTARKNEVHRHTGRIFDALVRSFIL